MITFKGPPAIKEPIAPPIAPPTASPTDRVESIKGFKMIMVRTMTASGQVRVKLNKLTVN